MINKILVVDDSSFYKKYVAEIVRELGYTNVETASDGTEALQIIKAGGIDLVFLDINMPVVSGVEVVESLKDFEKKPIIIMMTAVNDVLIMQRCLEQGAANYILKNASAEAIKKIVTETCHIYDEK